jgi:hypothetical protein
VKVDGWFAHRVAGEGIQIRLFIISSIEADAKDLTPGQSHLKYKRIAMRREEAHSDGRTTCRECC